MHYFTLFLCELHALLSVNEFLVHVMCFGSPLCEHSGKEDSPECERKSSYVEEKKVSH